MADKRVCMTIPQQVSCHKAVMQAVTAAIQMTLIIGTPAKVLPLYQQIVEEGAIFRWAHSECLY